MSKLETNSSIYLVEELRKIISGMPAGTKLPTIRALVSEYKASQSTIERALGKLQNEGLVNIRSKSGIYVSKMAQRKDLQLLFFRPQEDLTPSFFYGHLIERFLLYASIHEWRVRLVKISTDKEKAELPHSISADHLSLTFGISQADYETCVKIFGEEFRMGHILPQFEGSPAPSYLGNHRDIIEVPIAHFRSLGHHKIAYFHNHSSEFKNKPLGLRWQVFHECIVNQELHVEKNYLQYVDRNTKTCDEMVEELLKSKQRPTAILLDNTDRAPALYKSLLSRGIIPGREMAIIGINHSIGSHFMQPTLCTVGYDVDGSIEEFIQHLRDIDGGVLPQNIIPKISIIKGESCFSL